MPWTLQRDDLAALGRGASLLGAGGGGAPRLTELGAATTASWPVRVHGFDELDPSTPCVAVGIGGSTMVYGERLPETDPYAAAIAAIDRWTGTRAAAVCLTEIGGMNAISAVPLGEERQLVDVDLMGRALPELDQFTLLVDDVPGLVVAVSIAGRGVVLLDAARPADIEEVLRAAFRAAGGWAGIVIGGFAVGQLADHGIPGGIRRALDLGRGWGETDRPIAERVAAVGAELLAVGRIGAIDLHAGDVRVRTVDLTVADGAVVRVVARTESLACMIDGRVVARAPDIIDVVDPQSGAVLQLEDLSVGRSVAVLALRAPEWWTASPERLRRVLPSHYGVNGLDEVAA